ncbi:MAG: cell envelope biogenesis protein OmpA [Candidatus Rokubacteria bacterium]|nr:cell envelope biogenesis protein OmpA [Candidatus Rokubacteria bacterium]
MVAPLAGACAGSQKPVLYPNAKVQEVGREQAERDVDDCRRLAGDYVKNTAAKDIGKDAAVGGATGAATGAAGGAVHGAVSGRGAGGGAATGAAVGAAAGATAGAVRGAVKNTEPSPIYKEFVNRCLAERGYQVLGWQ